MKSTSRNLLVGLLTACSLSIAPMHIDAVEPVTEVCALKGHAHALTHTWPSDAGKKEGKFYCTTCRLAYMKTVSETYTPPGAPSGVTVSRLVNYTYDTTKGVAGEACSITSCPFTGPHTICGCGEVLESAQTHNRTYVNPDLKFESTSWSHNNAHEGDIFKSFRSESDSMYFDIYIDDEFVEQKHYFGHDFWYRVPKDGNLRIECDGYWSNNSEYLSTVDKDGVKWKLALAYSQETNGNQIPTGSYGDGVTMAASDSVSIGGKIHTDYQTSYIKTYLTAGQAVTMELVSKYSEDNASLVLANNDLEAVASTYTDYYRKNDILALVAPYSGWFYIFPCVWFVYDCNGSVDTQNTGTVTVRTSSLITPAITVAASPTSITLEKGQSSTIAATATPSTATITYASNNTAIATVSTSGTVTAKSAGSATITVTATT